MSTVDWRTQDAQLLPNPDRWGRGYGGEPYTHEQLEETRRYILEALATGQGLAGYEQRGLIHKAPGFEVSADGMSFILPPGFDADSPKRSEADPNLLEPNHPTSIPAAWRVPASREQFYRASGAPTDQHGRWVHPLGLQVMQADIPLCTGYGVGYEGGETTVVDVVVSDGENVLFNKRPDNGVLIPSLVGGYTWATDYTTLEEWRQGNRPVTLEGVYKAVRRIVRSKAGIELPPDAELRVVWGVRPWSSAQTLNFGTRTLTVAAQLETGASRHLAPDYQLTGAAWQPVRTIAPVVSQLWPDHRRGYIASTA